MSEARISNTVRNLIVITGEGVGKHRISSEFLQISILAKTCNNHVLLPIESSLFRAVLKFPPGSFLRL